MVCRSKRHGNRVSQEIVKYLGVAKTPDQLAALKQLGLTEIHSLECDQKVDVLPKDPCEGAPLGYMEEIARVSEGCREVFGATFNAIGLSSTFDREFCEKLKDVVIGRIASPVSKRRTSKLLAEKYGRTLSEDSIYRLMDRLIESEEEVRTRIFEMTKRFCTDSVVDVLFFDVTTLYFESQQSDQLRDFGYSKDRKVNEVQVVLALATTSNGLPVGYTLFSGKTAEVKTLLGCLQEWKKTLPIQNACIVADRAMMSENNLASMDQLSFGYVVAAKLRSLPKKIRDNILASGAELRASAKASSPNACDGVVEYSVEDRRLIVSYSEARALKDRSDRERLLARLAQKVPEAGTSPKKLVTNRGYLRFLKEETPGRMVFDDARVEEESRWDGLHGIITNDTSSSASSLLERYRRLWVIEESFRINKHNLAMRPIFHFKPRRIRAHILLCYLAFAISRYTQQQVSTFLGPMSIDRIRSSLGRVEASILEDRITGEQYKLPSGMDKEAQSIYRSVGLRRSTRPCRLPRRPGDRSGHSKN